MSPKISICVPNLNTRPFLAERFETIFGQSFQDWELIISDNFSDDGAWEFFEQLARRDKRLSIDQAPREGLYPNWNNCLRRAKGDYVYIATSDDTMALDCLEKLVGALERHRDCDLAHCPLIQIDESGIRFPNQWWPGKTVFGLSAGELVNQPHVRRAPYDGLLALTGQQTYFSFTQLLVRRSLFAQVGPFEARWGSPGDFNWYMKAGLVSNTVHVPDTWATLRVHPKAATSSVPFYTPEFYGTIEEMILDAVRACEGRLDPSVNAGLKSHWMDWTRDMRSYYAGLRCHQSELRRRLYQLAQVFSGTKAARSEIFGQLFKKPKWGDAAPIEIRLWLESLGLGTMIVPLTTQAVDQCDRR